MEIDMTYNLTAAPQALLCPDKLIPVSMLLKDSEIVPAEAGIYAWWFRGELAIVPLEGTLGKDEYRLLYIGIAPRRPSRAGKESRSNLRKRIVGNHLGNSISRSTLRRSLACLLAEVMDFRIYRDPAGKMIMSPEDELILTKWLSDNAAISWLSDDAPWYLEDHLLGSRLALPLNIQGSKHGFRRKLKSLRMEITASS
jgi:hypothetical protein